MAEGDRVKVMTQDEALEGTLMPEQKDFVVLKLASGYNIGIDKKRVREIKVLDKKKKREVELPKETPKKGLPKITILHTGGTIASKVDYETGGVVARFSPEEIMGMFPELKDIANIDSKLISNIFSEDMRFSHYNALAQEIEKEVKQGVAGIIVTHGTDTLHYTGAALSFMLQDLGVPVILVGSQRSSDRGSSDAAGNLLSAAFFIIASKNFAEVALCMHESSDDNTCLILPGTKSRKMHTSRRDAFKAISVTPWARVNLQKKKVDYFRTNYNKRATKPVKVRLFKENLEVGLIKMHPHLYAREFEAYRGFDGLIVEGFGIAGNIPINETDKATKEHRKIAAAVEQLVKAGTIVFATSQCIAGSLNMNVYSTGRHMQELGVIGNYCDMTAETAFIKLAWLLSNHKKDEVSELMTKNLVGEISERNEVVE